MTRYKEAGNGEFVRISTDESGKELSRTASFGPKNKPDTMGAGFYAEMLEWDKVEGNEIEPQYTAEEQAAKDQEESDAAAVAWIGERESEYIKEGCTEKELIVALWEKVVENRPEAADALEVKRQAVKIKIPKPE